jgi:colanic acid/amylovoran biosynthesis glycosyltransferase
VKIGYLTNQYPHVRHTFIRREIAALEALGVEVLRFSMRGSGAECVDPADLKERNQTRPLLHTGAVRLIALTAHALVRHPLRWIRAFIRATRLGRRSGTMLRHWAYLAEACVLLRELKRSNVEHLHVHFATNPAAVALLARDLGGPPYSITIHGPEEWDRPEALSLTEKYENASFVVAVSDFGRCQVWRWIDPQHWDKVHVIRCGVDETFLRAQPEPVPDTNRLILVAGLAPQKGHLFLLRALAEVVRHGDDFEMVFAGDGPLRLLLEKEIARLELQARIRITGWQSNVEVRELLRSARALVMPSFAENLPVAMMEALAMGRPVLATYVAGVPELIEHGVNGWLVPAGNIAATASAIRAILATPAAELTRMGRAGARVVAARHDAAREAAKLAELFQAYATDRTTMESNIVLNMPHAPTIPRGS